MDFLRCSQPPHSFPAGIPASPFISSWDLCLPIHFHLRSLLPNSFPAEIFASPFISSWDHVKTQPKVWKTIRIHWFLSFLAPKRKSVCNFFKITTTFTVQIAICWPCYRVLFRPDSPRHRPIFGGPRGRNPQIKTTISITPKVGDFFRRSRLPFRPHLPTHIPRMTFVASNSYVNLRELVLPHDPSPECLQVQTRTARRGGRRGCHRPKRM